MAEQRTPAQRYGVAPDLVVRRSLADGAAIQLCWGGGARRQELTTTSPGLASWLLGAAPGPLASMVSSAAAALGITESEAADTIDHLLRSGLLRPAESDERELAGQWLACNLYDALSFHRATRNPRRHEAAAPDRGTGHDGGDDDAGRRPGVCLPPPTDLLRQQEFFRSLHWRRSTRNFAGTHITLQQVADVLWWSGRAGGPERSPITVFAVFDPDRAPPEVASEGAVFRYRTAGHALVPIRSASRPGRLAELLSEQDFVDGAPVMLVLAIEWERYMRSGSPFEYRVAHHDAGAFMQRTLLVATALGLRTFITAALDDARFEALLGTDDRALAPTYIVALGGSPWQRGGMV